MPQERSQHEENNINTENFDNDGARPRKLKAKQRREIARAQSRNASRNQRRGSHHKNFGRVLASS
jgi:hypothetical protein